MEVCGQHHALTALLPGKKTGTHCTGSYLGPIISLEVFGDEKISDMDSDSGPSIPCPDLSYAEELSLGRTRRPQNFTNWGISIFIVGNFDKKDFNHFHALFA
jgi:hypothetical protein